MYQFEKKFIDWVNRYIIQIALFLVVFSAIWMRLAGRNYVGIDFHYSLYDIPGNCNALPYRFFVDLLMRMFNPIVPLKFLAYLGDFGVALLSLYLLWNETQKIWELRTFLIVSACLLSPVALLYSVAGMEIDSVCMCFILLGFIFHKKGKWGFAVFSMILAAFLYPAYWPIVGVILIFLLTMATQKYNFNKQLLFSIGIFIGCLLLSVLSENLLSTENYFWGKIFIINPATGVAYESFLLWLKDMFKIYGYFLASGSLLLALKQKKMRIPALIIQVLVIAIVGWQMTSHFAV